MLLSKLITHNLHLTLSKKFLEALLQQTRTQVNDILGEDI